MRKSIPIVKHALTFMKITILQILIAVGLSGLVVASYGQAIKGNALTTSGSIVDENSQPLPGVSVIEKGTMNGTTTDVDGKYSLNVQDENSVLVFSFIGYATQEVPLNGRSVIDVVLAPDVQSLDEVIIWI